MMTDDPVVPLPVTVQDDTNGNRDLFSLLYVTEETDRTVVPPSRWATFECKNLLSNIFFAIDKYIHILLKHGQTIKKNKRYLTLYPKNVHLIFKIPHSFEPTFQFLIL